MLNLITISAVLILLIILLFYHRQKSHHRSFTASVVMLGAYLATGFMKVPFLSTFVILLIALFMAKLYKIKIKNKVSYIYLVFSIALGFAFGKAFVMINEPNVDVVQFVVFALLVALSEELMFRLVMLKQLEKDFNFRFALVMQALFFVVMHAIDLDFLWSYYSNVFYLVGYVLLLFLFAIVAGLFMKGKRGCILYPIVLHFFANLVLFSL